MIDYFQIKMGLPAVDDRFADVLSGSLEEYKTKGVFFLEPGFLFRVHHQTGAFPRILPQLQQAAEELSEDSTAAGYALFVYRAMERRELFLQCLDQFQFPQQYPLMPLLCLSPSIQKTWQNMIQRNVPEDVLHDTIAQYEACVFLHAQRYDSLGLAKRYFDHLQLYVDSKILNIERLRFEQVILEDPVYVLQHRQNGEIALLMGAGRFRHDGLYSDTPPETSGASFEGYFWESENAYHGTPVTAQGRCASEQVHLRKEEYKLVAKPGDACLSVHIPDTGALTVSACQKSYTRALEVFRRFAPEEKYSFFHCHSWMLAPELHDILRPDSNILAFQKTYKCYPVHTRGEDVLNFVFRLRFNTFKDLPEDTSLQRALKKRYLAGSCLYEYGGIFLVPAYE